MRGKLKIITAILEQPVIEKVLTHLGLQARAPLRAPQHVGRIGCTPPEHAAGPSSLRTRSHGVRSPPKAPTLRSSAWRGPVGRHGLLARLAGLTGAEWSLFCPGMGIALDSSVRVIRVLVRPAVGSGLGVSFPGAKTESAAGTEGVAMAGCVPAASTLTGSTVGIGGVGRPLSQAPNSIVERHRAAKVTGVRMEILQLGGSAGRDGIARRIPKLG